MVNAKIDLGGQTSLVNGLGPFNGTVSLKIPKN
jgi:hypothetical protein